MLENAKIFFKCVVSNHAEQYKQFVQLRNTVQNTKDIRELADIALTLREAKKYLDDQQAEIYKLNDVVIKVLGALWVQQSAARAEGPQPIHTEYVTATPELETSATLPTIKKDLDGFTALMNHFGVPVESQAILRFHWPTMNKYLTQLAQEGKPLPPGIDGGKTYSQYAVALRQHKEILSNERVVDTELETF